MSEGDAIDGAVTDGALNSCGQSAAPWRGLWWPGHWPRGVAQRTGALVWLAFILYPAANAIGKHGSELKQALTIAGAVAFTLAYIALVLTWRSRRAERAVPVLFVLLVALATGLTLSDASSWGFLFIYCAACVGLISPQFGFAGVIGCAALVGVTSAVGGANAGQVIGWVAACLGIGFLLLVLRDLRTRNDELSSARAELARMAVAEERQRFARDLHDLLGHSLSVIALKAELAGRLLPDRADEAQGEIAELEQVARGALSEVRDAVSGYRRPTLEGELSGAQMALSAAGIRSDLDRSPTALDPEVEAVLAWAVREGATNVIRHSHARHCTVTVRSSLTDAAVEVVDDGVGASNGAGEPDFAGGANRRAGHGLAGLAERARSLHGRIEAGGLPEGGYRLAVTVPVSDRP